MKKKEKVTQFFRSNWSTMYTFSWWSVASWGQFHPRSSQPWTAGEPCSQNYNRYHMIVTLLEVGVGLLRGSEVSWYAWLSGHWLGLSIIKYHVIGYEPRVIWQSCDQICMSHDITTTSPVVHVPQIHLSPAALILQSIALIIDHLSSSFTVALHNRIVVPTVQTNS